MKIEFDNLNKQEIEVYKIFYVYKYINHDCLSKHDLIKNENISINILDKMKEDRKLVYVKSNIKEYSEEEIKLEKHLFMLPAPDYMNNISEFKSYISKLIN